MSKQDKRAAMRCILAWNAACIVGFHPERVFVIIMKNGARVEVEFDGSRRAIFAILFENAEKLVPEAMAKWNALPNDERHKLHKREWTVDLSIDLLQCLMDIGWKVPASPAAGSEVN